MGGDGPLSTLLYMLNNVHTLCRVNILCKQTTELWNVGTTNCICIHSVFGFLSRLGVMKHYSTMWVNTNLHGSSAFCCKYLFSSNIGQNIGGDICISVPPNPNIGGDVSPPQSTPLDLPIPPQAQHRSISEHIFWWRGLLRWLGKCEPRSSLS